mmetsp:Transcript_105109/g.296005  ORF Transcript_105109/g.296005 Transcript_105109/m.296005 type:complete len:219 (-) Transcript_105109:60-716(-)
MPSQIADVTSHWAPLRPERRVVARLLARKGPARVLPRPQGLRAHERVQAKGRPDALPLHCPRGEWGHRRRTMGGTAGLRWTWAPFRILLRRPSRRGGVPRGRLRRRSSRWHRGRASLCCPVDTAGRGLRCARPRNPTPSWAWRAGRGTHRHGPLRRWGHWRCYGSGVALLQAVLGEPAHHRVDLRGGDDPIGAWPARRAVTCFFCKFQSRAQRVAGNE